MSIPYIAPVDGLPGTSLSPSTTVVVAPGGPAAEPGFASLVGQGLQQVNERVLAADAQLQQLAAGDAASLHRVMLSLEQARLSFHLMLQVRSRLLESFQDLMRMPL